MKWLCLSHDDIDRRNRVTDRISLLAVVVVVVIVVAVSRTMPRLPPPYGVISLLTLGLREIEDEQLGHSVLVCMHLPITREISATPSRHGGGHKLKSVLGILLDKIEQFHSSFMMENDMHFFEP